MTRMDLQVLSKMRLDEAKALLAAGHSSGSYYLAGYSVECALKACIAKQTRQFDFPDKQRAIDSFVHDLDKLSKVARLNEGLYSNENTSLQLQRNWRLVIEWSERSRYTRYDDVAAESMLFAVGDETHGVLPWIMLYW